MIFMVFVQFLFLTKILDLHYRGFKIRIQNIVETGIIFGSEFEHKEIYMKTRNLININVSKHLENVHLREC